MPNKSESLQFKNFKCCLVTLLLFCFFIDENTSSQEIESLRNMAPIPVYKKSNVLPRKKMNNFKDFSNSLLDFLSSENLSKLDPCHDKSSNSPKRCLSVFENVAFGKKVLASRTCGALKPAKPPCDLSKANILEGIVSSAEHISLQGHSTSKTNSDEDKHNRRSVPKEVIGGALGSCGEVGICDSSELHLDHPTAHLTDLNNPSTMTCWISDPLPSDSANVALPSTSSSQLKNTNNSSFKINSLGNTHETIRKHVKGLKSERNKTDLKSNLRLKNKLKEIKRPNISLTLNFGKKYEITYVSLQFCVNTIPSDIPMAIYKSSDFGKTWNPFQFYANNCKQFFGIPAKLYASISNEQEVLCTDLQHATVSESTEIIGFYPSRKALENSLTSWDRNIGERGQHSDENLSSNDSTNIAFGIHSGNSQNFPTMIQTPTTPHSDKVSTLASKLVAATRGRRNHPKFIGAKSFLSKNRVISPNWGRAALNVAENRVAFSTLEGRPSAYNLDKSPVLQDWMTVTDIQVVFFSPSSINSSSKSVSLADLSVGGRCKCNGHAHRCIKDNEGRTICDCKHNTAGVDCEKCKHFYYDRPWGRATLDDPHPCIACHCNGHTKQCRFSLELYKMSGQRSGSVCIRCRHHTSGRNCHYCKEGYYRDYSESISSKRACKRCTCHLIGSLDSTCNHATGQCRCKDGVTGLSCNSCAKGYQQSRSPLSPCTRFLSANESSTRQVTSSFSSVTSACGRCPKEGSLKRKLFCASEYVLQAKVRSIEMKDSWAIIRIFIYHSYKHPEGKIKHKSEVVWISKKDFNCNCPYKIEENRSYLFVGSPGELMSDMENNLQLDRKSYVTPWNKRLVLKVTQLVRDQQRGRCNLN